jgi:hypothetical protein
MITQDIEYHVLGPIGLIGWAQEVHTQLVTDHDWVALADKLPESNLSKSETHLAKTTYASKVNNGGRKCYRCGSEDHLRPDCPQPPKYNETRGGGEMRKAEDQRVRKPLAAWKYIQPNDLTKSYPYEDGKEWKFCTQCACRVSSKKGFFRLSHLDAEHKDNFRPEANLSLLDDPKTPAMPPMITTKEPEAKEEDEDEMVFISAWCCVA